MTDSRQRDKEPHLPREKPISRSTGGAHEELRCSIRARLLRHFDSLGINGDKLNLSDKAAVRAIHLAKREDILKQQSKFIEKHGLDLLERYFADGNEIIPSKIRPILKEVQGRGAEANLFRLATLLWSVPVSRGFGRRMRYLVLDASNRKLIGIFGLCDPVFNLKVRDEWIGWSVEDRQAKLVNVMDAFVVGAVPPYSQLIGGKIVAALMTSSDVVERFAAKYASRRGVISGKVKGAQLALITVTSALGRSSLYNRLRLPGLFEFQLIGRTQGWGHFHIPDDIFADMRRLLEMEGHPYANGNRFGQGPNWRLRTIRVALDSLGLDQNLVRHGITREVYASPLAHNWRECLRANGPPCRVERPSAEEIGRQAVERWAIPRAARRPEYRKWTRQDTLDLIMHPITRVGKLGLPIDAPSNHSR